MERIAVIDFETTGISPGTGCRATEVAVVMLEGGRIVERYQSLMNAGVPVPAFVAGLTGITTAMLRSAPPVDKVMNEVAEFVGGTPLLAHNAAFDQKFWDFELSRIGRSRSQPFACSLLLSRRLLPAAPNHKLGTLTRWLGCQTRGPRTGPWPMPKWPPTCCSIWRVCCTRTTGFSNCRTSCFAGCRRPRLRSCAKRWPSTAGISQ